MGERRQVDFNMLALRGKYPIPEGWAIYSWERKNFGKPTEYIEFKGAICTEIFKRGPRKGRKNWAKRTHEMSLPMTHAELEAACEQWSKATGLCYHCVGNGTAWAGWNAAAGNIYKPCKRCDATGKIGGAA